MRGVWVSSAVVVGMLAGWACAQDVEPASPYFECPYINFFDDDCPQMERDEAQAQPLVEDERERPAGEGQEEGEQDLLQEVPEHLLPLFRKESLAPDTPELYRLLLERPTLANARRYVRWYSRRMKRIREVQEVIAVAGREFLAQPAARE